MVYLNLFLKNQKVEFVPQMQWAALGAARQKIFKMSLSSIMVPRRGFEPPRPCGHTLLKRERIPVPPPGHKSILSYYHFSALLMFIFTYWRAIRVVIRVKIGGIYFHTRLVSIYQFSTP